MKVEVEIMLIQLGKNVALLWILRILAVPVVLVLFAAGFLLNLLYGVVGAFGWLLSLLGSVAAMLPPSRHCFTWAHATSPNYDGWPQAPVIRRADLLHRLRQTRQFLLRCHASSCFLFSCVFMPALLLWLYRQWLSVLPFRP